MESTYSSNKYSLSWESHPKHMFKSICSLMEHQSLVDIAICCGNNTLHAHKCILAANSSYFRDELEKNTSIEQIIVTGFDFAVLKAMIEFIYCGETVVAEEHMKFLIAASKQFQLRGLDILFSDRQEYQHLEGDVYIPFPQFVTTKPKYPMAYHPFNNNSAMTSNVLKPVNYNIPDPYNQRKMKRKYIRTEAEKACAKEAQASRMALAHLQKEIASTPQVGSFIIEESCTETTVENFIPHTDENFVGNLNNIQHVSVVNLDLENNLYNSSNSFIEEVKPTGVTNYESPSAVDKPQLSADKIKNIFGPEIPSNVEIMFKTSDGSFVTVTDEVFQNIPKGGLQYQVVDENGRLGEVQDLTVVNRNSTHISKQDEIINNADVCKNLQNQNSSISNPVHSQESNLNSFNITNEELSKIDISENKPMEFVLLENASFENDRIPIPSYFSNEHFTSVENKRDLNGPSPVVRDFMEDSLKFGSMKSKLPEQFSPDIFFADLPSTSTSTFTETVEKR